MEIIDRLNEKIMIAEGMLTGVILQKPNLLNDYTINKKLLSEDGLFYIGITNKLLQKGIEVVDEVAFKSEVDSLGLTDTYKRLGGWRTVTELMVADVKNIDSIFDNWTKWNLIKKYNDKGILNVDQHWDKLIGMTTVNVEDYLIAILNDIAITNGIDGAVEVVDLTKGYEEAINEWDKGTAIGYKIGFPILNYTLCGLHKGTLTFLLAHSGNGKTSFAIPCAILPILEQGEKIIILANEQGVDDWRQMLLATILFNKVKYKGKMNRQKFLYGGFSDEDRAALRESVKWIEQYQGNLQFVELQDYGTETIRRILKKYSRLGFGMAVLDTLKPEDDASDKSWGQFSETAKELFVVAKQCDISLLCTAQLASSSYGRKFLDINCIGKSKAIAEVASQIIMFRSIQDAEKEKLKVWRNKKDPNTGKIISSVERVELDNKKDYVVLFIAKNRYGEANVQLVYERNMAFNKYIEIGYTSIEYDGFGR